MGIIQQLKTEGVLKGYWDFRSGTFSDDSGNDHDITPTGIHLDREGLSLVNGVVGSQFGIVTNHADFSFGTTTDYSVYVWLKTRNLTPNYRILGNTDLSPAGGFAMDLTSGSPRIFHQGAAGGDYVMTASSAATTQVPTHICATLDRSDTATGGKMYVNGVEVSVGYANASAIGDTIDSGEDLKFGRIISQTNLNFDGYFYTILIVNRLLTATEINQIQGELEGTNWPTKTSGRNIKIQIPDTNNSDLYTGFEMTPVAGELIDLSVNGNDATIVDTINEINVLGKSLRFNGTSSYGTFGSTSSHAWMHTTGVFTLSAWVKLEDWTAAGSQAIFATAHGTPQHGMVLYYDGTNDSLKSLYINGATATAGTSTTSDMGNGLWNHVVFVGDGSKINFYVNGNYTEGTTIPALSVSATSNYAPQIGRYNPSSPVYFTGEIMDYEIFDTTKDQAWVSAKYAKGASAVQYKIDWGIAESNDAISSSGFIRDSDFTIISGQWRVNSTSDTKSVYCQASGVISLPTSIMAGDSEEAAYGTWEFTINKGGTAPLWGFAAQANAAVLDASQNCYVLHIDGSRRLRLRKVTAGSLADLFYTAAAYVDNAVDYRVRITRSPTGVFTGYIKGGAFTDWTLIVPEVGTNPATDNAFTTADYVVWDIDAGDSFILSKRNGDDSFIKRAGVYNG